MPIKVEVDGEIKETFTHEELEAQKTEAIEQYKKDNPDKSEELQKLQDEMKGLKDKDLNFSQLREQKKSLEERLQELTGSVKTDIENVKKEIVEGVMKEFYAEHLQTLTQGDADLMAKVELQYKRLADPAASKEEISKKLKDAFILATGTNAGGISSQAFSSGGVSPINPQVSQKLNDEESALLEKMGEAGGLKIDIKKYK